MINPTGKKLQDLTSKLIDGEIEGVDKYTLNGSTWLIFTDQKRWVVEYTEDGILWYNFSFFTEIFEILGMKATDNQNLIQEWFESKFLRPQISDIECSPNPPHDHAEEVIQNGVKHTNDGVLIDETLVEHTIQNGVKETLVPEYVPYYMVERTIQNGVKETQSTFRNGSSIVEHTIQNGVKYTLKHDDNDDKRVEDTIQNGVKRTLKCLHRKSLVEDTIQNGVKDTKLKSGNQTGKVEHTLQKGVKETFESKSTKSISLRHTIKNGVKHTIDRESNSKWRVEDAIQNGVKKTMHLDMDDDYVLVIEDTIQNGVKEIGYKKTPDESFTNHIIKDGVKEIHDDRSKNIGRVEGVVRIGEKLN